MNPDFEAVTKPLLPYNQNCTGLALSFGIGANVTGFLRGLRLRYEGEIHYHEASIVKRAYPADF